jgi:hypothetical protein
VTPVSVLDGNVKGDLTHPREARIGIAGFMERYNYHRPHQ